MIVSRSELNGTHRLPPPDPPGHGQPANGAADAPPQPLQAWPPATADGTSADSAAPALPDVQPPADAGPCPPRRRGRRSLGAVLKELRAIRRAIEAQLAGPAELLDSDGAAALLGLARSTFFRLVALGTLPRPLKLSGQLRRWRRSALLAALDELEGRTKRRRPGS